MSEKIRPKKMPNKRRKVGGKFSRDDIDWDLAETFYIQGEIIQEKNKQGDLVRKKPSMTDVARKFSCGSSLVHYHAKKRNWREKRETWERMAAREVSQAVAKARALSFAEAATILDSWLLKFEQALREDKVRIDSLSDFNTAMRLKGFIESQGSSAADTKNDAVTLDDLRKKHREQRERSDTMTRSMTGVIEPSTQGGPIH